MALIQGWALHGMAWLGKILDFDFEGFGVQEGKDAFSECETTMLKKAKLRLRSIWRYTEAVIGRRLG